MLREQRLCWGVGYATTAQLAGMPPDASDENLFHGLS